MPDEYGGDLTGGYDWSSYDELGGEEPDGETGDTQSGGGTNLASLLSMAAPLIGGLFGASGQRSANKTNLEIANAQMAFQREQSATAHQREVADLIKAGLNPVLSTAHQGAVSGSGATTRVENTSSAGVSSAMQAQQIAQAQQAIMQSKAQEEALMAQAEKTRSETVTNDIVTAQALANVDTATARNKLTGTQNLLTEEQTANERWKNRRDTASFDADVARRKAESQLRQLDIPAAQNQAKFQQSDIGGFAPYLQQLIQVVRAITNASGSSRF